MSTTEALIIGAGPTGLAMAIELRRQGMPYRLVEKNEHPAQYSQALVVQARTLEQFERYGIADRTVAAGRETKGADIFSEQKQIARMTLDKIPGRYPYVLFLPQSETERILTEHLESLGGRIERGINVEGIEMTSDGVRAATAQEQIEARWLIGCDGAHSIVRRALKVPFPGDTVGFAFDLGDLELEGSNLPGDDLRLYLHHGDVLLLARLKENVFRVIWAKHGQVQEQIEGKERQPTEADFQAAIDEYAGSGIRITGSKWMTPFRVNQRKVEHYRVGNAFMAGDASHIHSPVGGQGMNTGLQDAANLGWKLGAVRKGAPEHLLDSYDEERGAVGKALLRITSRGLTAATLENPIAEMMRDAVLSFGTRLEIVREAMAGFVSETAINYRKSSIVVDAGGRGSLHAGDRVPNPDVADGRLLDPLRDGRPLVLAIDTPELEDLPSRFPRATVKAYQNGEGRQLWIVRPDGYLGYRGAADGPKLDEYARLTGLV
jgi:2-polyprenyl-6-methoxyphenol hydroxylase-like FAD-dependent oxidoreductase